MSALTKLTVADILQRVADIQALADDPEVAHSCEDALHSDVLAAIAQGACDDPAACAAAALTTQAIDFPRWCA